MNQLLCLIALSVASSRSTDSFAALIQYQATDLSDVHSGQALSNDRGELSQLAAETVGFDIYFPPCDSDQMGDLMRSVSVPNSGLSAEGLPDVLDFSLLLDFAAVFSHNFIWRHIGFPESQEFESYGIKFNVSESG